MVYKIVGNFTDYNFEKILKKIENDYVFLYYNNALYFSAKNIEFILGESYNINSILKNISQLVMIEINQDNILLEDELAGEWCKNRFVDLEKQKFEKDKQALLKQAWDAMNVFENKLKKIKGKGVAEIE